MNSDPEDPDNHVPPISTEGNLDEFGELSGEPRNVPAKRKRRSVSRNDTPPPSHERKRFPLPPAQGSKRLCVNEIDPSGDPVAVGSESKLTMFSKVSIEAGKEVGFVRKKRRRLSGGERKDWGGKGRRGSPGWMIPAGVGVCILVVLLVAIGRILKDQGRGEGGQSQYSRLEPAKDKPATDIEDLKNIEILANSHERAKSIYAIYACATKPEDFMAYVHAPEANRELIEKNWKPLGMKPGWRPDEASTWLIREGDGFRYAVLLGSLGDFTGFRAYFRRDRGAMQLDWKATYGYGSADFSDMKKGDGDGREVRAWVSLENFHTFAFPEDEYTCFKLMSASGDLNLWGYVPVGSEPSEELRELLLPGDITREAQSMIQATLRLEPGPGESLPDQWLISGVVRLSWLDE